MATAVRREGRGARPRTCSVPTKLWPRRRASSCASITTLMAFSVKRCVGGGEGVRKGQEGNLGGHDRRHTCANLAFPVEERPGEARGRAAASPRAGSPRRGSAFGDRADWTRESPGDSWPPRLGSRGRRGGRVRRHLAHAPRTWPSRRTSCRRARPLGSDARRSSGRRPSAGDPEAVDGSRAAEAGHGADGGGRDRRRGGGAAPNLAGIADVHRGANANGGGSDAEHVSNCRVHVSDTTRRSAQTILARSTKRVGRGLTSADARGNDVRVRRTRGSTASVHARLPFLSRKSPEPDREISED